MVLYCYSLNPGAQDCTHIAAQFGFYGTGTKDGFTIGVALPVILVSIMLSLAMLVLFRFRRSCKTSTGNDTVKKEVDESGNESDLSRGKYLMDILQVSIIEL